MPRNCRQPNIRVRRASSAAMANGGHSSMLRLRFPAVPSNRHTSLSEGRPRPLRYRPHPLHDRRSLQLHHLNEKEVLDLYQECFNHGIYCVGAGSDNPRNITASPLHGVAPGEYFDMTPYIKAAANFVINCIPKFNLPRKYKISFSSGLDNEGHATFKDLGFVARPDHTFDVYAGGGFGVNGSRFGILIDEGIDPMDIPYYILGYGRDVYMKYGDYEHRAKNRSRFILDQLGEDAFRKKPSATPSKKARQEGIPRVLPRRRTGPYQERRRRYGPRRPPHPQAETRRPVPRRIQALRRYAEVVRFQRPLRAALDGRRRRNPPQCR